MQDDSILFSIQQTRERLGGISRSTLYNLLSRGELRLVKIGRRSFITAESLQDFVRTLGR